jgi:hypothetical protein
LGRLKISEVILLRTSRFTRDAKIEIIVFGMELNKKID